MTLAGSTVQGFNVTFSPTQAYQTFESTMLIKVPMTVAPGVYSLVVGASCAGLNRAATFTITVSAALVQYDILLSASPVGGGTTYPSPGTYEQTPGTSVTVAALPSPDWVFDHWDLNGTPIESSQFLTTTVSQNNTVLTAFFIYQPKTSQPTATVDFFAQGYSGAKIEVDGSNYSLPASFSWPLGSSHNISASSFQASGSRVDFLGWATSLGGTQSSNATDLRLITSQSQYIVANYQEQVLARLSFVDATGRQLNPQDATMLGPSGGFSIQSNQSVWLVSGAHYSLLSARIMGVEVAPIGASADIFVGGSSRMVTFPLLVYGAQVKVVDIFGMPLEGALVSLTTINGQSMSMSTNTTGEASFKGIPYGVYTADVSYMGVSYRVNQNAMGDNPVTMTLTLSYPLAATVLVVAGVSFYTVIRRMRRVTHPDYLIR